ncbi:hypothetical protein [Kribbella sp. NPDC004875]|uniref:hypothetical protein n=1 Tax=Kribbella sp. NPDC004875 TaxID=3364107 RepID=UPI003676FC85
MEQERGDEVLEVGKGARRGRRRIWWGLVLAVLLGLIVLRGAPDRARHQVLPSPKPTDLISTRPDGPTAWATAVGACGADTPLPIVSSGPPLEHSGIQVLVGGDRLRLVDFDTGRVTTLPDVVVHPGEYAAVLARDPLTAYATTGSCSETAPYAMVRVSVDHRVRVIRPLSPNESALTDGRRVWITAAAGDINSPYATITPLTGGTRVRLPLGFAPSAIVGDTVVGQLQPDPGISPTWLALVDGRTGRLRAKLEEHGAPLAAGAGQVFWTSGCEDATPCTLRRIAIAGGDIVAYPLPRQACCGVVSPDGTTLAFLLDRSSTGSLPPLDIAILQLATGRMSVVPGIELPAKSQPGLTFAGHDNWLVIALNAGSATRLLAWRPGLHEAYETAPTPGAVHDPITAIATGP